MRKLFGILLSLSLGKEPASCPDSDAAFRCQEHCFAEQDHCRRTCGESINCLVDCGLAVVECLNYCPCYKYCPDECDECQSSFCKCNDGPENDESYLICAEQALQTFYQCLSQCKPGELICQAECDRDYARNLDMCPCMTGCPDGCPCPDYECPTTTSTTTPTATATTTTTVTPEFHTLVLSKENNLVDKALVVSSSGSSRDAAFTYGEGTTAYHSCSVIWRNNFYLFGGAIEKQQVAQVDKCSLKRIGSLSFEFNIGGCGVDHEENIYLCFHNPSDKKDKATEGKTCRKSFEPIGDFEPIKQSNFTHLRTRIAFSESYLFTTSSCVTSNPELNNRKTELLMLKNGSWRTSSDYPYSEYLYLAPVLNYLNGFVIFGGSQSFSAEITDRITFFNEITEEWSQLGSLNVARGGNGVVRLGDGFLVLGGWDNFETEWCEINDEGSFYCTSQTPILDNFAAYPEMLEVDENYCQ